MIEELFKIKEPKEFVLFLVSEYIYTQHCSLIKSLDGIDNVLFRFQIEAEHEKNQERLDYLKECKHYLTQLQAAI